MRDQQKLWKHLEAHPEQTALAAPAIRGSRSKSEREYIVLQALSSTHIFSLAVRLPCLDHQRELHYCHIYRGATTLSGTSLQPSVCNVTSEPEFPLSGKVHSVTEPISLKLSLLDENISLKKGREFRKTNKMYTDIRNHVNHLELS